jgi:hypothetical protein
LPTHQEPFVYSTYEVHVVDHPETAEVINDLPFELAYAMAVAKHGVVIERVHYELDTVDTVEPVDKPTVPQPRRG